MNYGTPLIIFERKQEVKFTKTNFKTDKKINCSVSNEGQLKVCLELGVDRIFVMNLDLYKKYQKYSNVYYMLNRCLLDVNSNLQERSLVSDFANYTNYEVVGNYSLNVTNIYTAYYLSKIGIKSITLSVELTPDEINNFLDSYETKFGSLDFIVLVYGRIENMIIKGNILEIKDNDNSYKLIDINGREFPVFYDGVNTHILNYENKSLDIGIMKNNYNYRYDFYNENEIEIKNILLKNDFMC